MKTGRLLWCVQCYPGDMAQAQELVRLCAQLTLQANGGQPSPHADFMLAMRWDCDIPMPFLREIAPAFQKVRTFRCRNRITGWPAGCNNLASEAYQYFAFKVNGSGWDYSGIFLTEADSLPLTADFLARIHREWRATTKPILGCLIGSFTGKGNVKGEGHINGNCVMSPQLPTLIPGFLSHPTPIAWDAYHRRAMVANAHPSTTIFSDYQLGDEAKNPWRDCAHLWRPIEYFDNHPQRGIVFSPVWLHGCKDTRGLECVRERLLRSDLTPVKTGS